jgi:ketosteroid isomerase-like protein
MHALPLALTALLTAAASDAVAARATARAYFEAILRGDADAALALVAEPSEADRIAVRASAASEHGLRRVEELALSRFGEHGDLGIAARHRRLLAAIDGAPVEVNGDRAVVRPPGERPLRLRRAGGAWKVESPADRLSGDERKALERALRRTEEATKDLAERIRSGALESAKGAREALRRALGKDDEDGVPL